MDAISVDDTAPEPSRSNFWKIGPSFSRSSPSPIFASDSFVGVVVAAAGAVVVEVPSGGCGLSGDGVLERCDFGDGVRERAGIDEEATLVVALPFIYGPAPFI